MISGFPTTRAATASPTRDEGEPLVGEPHSETQQLVDGQRRPTSRCDTLLWPNKLNYAYSCMNGRDWICFTSAQSNEPFRLFWCGRLRKARCGNLIGGSNSIICYNVLDLCMLALVLISIIVSFFRKSGLVIFALLIAGIVLALDALVVLTINACKLASLGINSLPLAKVRVGTIGDTEDYLNNFVEVTPETMDTLAPITERQQNIVEKLLETRPPAKVKLMLFHPKWIRKNVVIPSIFLLVICLTHIAVTVWRGVRERSVRGD
eukprot:gb/GECG01009991.1/.p1 GENE.gb/GECG01009991.1/~~gb/GECG01009991.1/.p1  ORF type:complete len:264 (+),score=0.58 gb/GECG01009991.1/:1-792(+)